MLCKNRCCRSSGEICLCDCSRYIDVPMSVYYGPGYTEEDALIGIEAALEEISETLRSMRCGCSRCCR